MIDGEPLFGGEDGEAMIKVDPDRIIDRAFCVAHTHRLGRESQPSEVSEMLEADQKRPGDGDLRRAAGRAQRAERGGCSLDRDRKAHGGRFSSSMKFWPRPESHTRRAEVASIASCARMFTWAERRCVGIRGSAGSDRQPGPVCTCAGWFACPTAHLAGFYRQLRRVLRPVPSLRLAGGVPDHDRASDRRAWVCSGRTLFVGTMGHPYLISGADSASMSAQKLPHFQACVARRSIVGVGMAWCMPARTACALASARGVEVLTQGLFSREDWRALNPSSIVAAEHDGCTTSGRVRAAGRWIFWPRSWGA